MTRKRISAIVIVVLAAAVIPTLASAKPTPARHYELGPNGEIPAIVQDSPEETPAASDAAWSIELNPYTVIGFALALIGVVMFAIGVAYWRRCKTKLAHAWCR
jgi:predicted cobalt transporter CbtA